jgi:hypothetical protein
MMTLDEAKAELKKGLKEGTLCPCCGQDAKVYRRSISTSMVKGLLLFADLHGSDWGHVPSIPDLARLGGDWSKLRYWGLIEERIATRENGARSGEWRITDTGRAFLAGSKVKKYAYTFNAVVYPDSSGPDVSISEVLPLDLRSL